MARYGPGMGIGGIHFRPGYSSVYCNRKLASLLYKITTRLCTCMWKADQQSPGFILEFSLKNISDENKKKNGGARKKFCGECRGTLYAIPTFVCPSGKAMGSPLDQPRLCLHLPFPTSLWVIYHWYTYCSIRWRSQYYSNEWLLWWLPQRRDSHVIVQSFDWHDQSTFT